jgi:hypothetical protein
MVVRRSPYCGVSRYINVFIICFIFLLLIGVNLDILISNCQYTIIYNLFMDGFDIFECLLDGMY